MLVKVPEQQEARRRILELHKAGFAPTPEQTPVAERMLEACGHEILSTRDDGVASFAFGARFGLLLVGWDVRGPLFRPIGEHGVTDSNRFLNHPVTLEAAIRQLERQESAGVGRFAQSSPVLHVITVAE
jgi:hypothetical protein